MIIQFIGQDRRDSICNHFALDIEEERDFFKFIEDMGYFAEDDDETIENLHKMWEQNR
jgi:hypothetical protein